jgi:uncharacterized protein (DUF169 family)
MSYNELSILLCDSVGLEHAPVALAFVDRQPDGVSVASKLVPSSCSFWRAAEQQVFYAEAAAHNGCAVGAHVMGFPLSEETAAELMASVNLMVEVGYLPENEVAAIPRVAESGAGIVYGPLADFPLEPSAVVVWVNPAQAMVLEEALKTTSWKREHGGFQELFGRPACGAVARAVNSQNSAFSLGCAGMRTFTGIPPALSLLVIPNAALSTLAAELRQIRRANDQMLDHYKAKLAAFA